MYMENFVRTTHSDIKRVKTTGVTRTKNLPSTYQSNNFLYPFHTESKLKTK